MNYGWTTYKNLNWKRDDGRKLYKGIFRAENDPYSFTVLNIRFWAKRPVSAMRLITIQLCAGKEFQDYEIIN